MVRKLYKYEILYYLQSLLPFQLIVPVMALLSRITQFFKSDTEVYDLIYGSSTSIFVIALLVCYVMNFVSAITRFHKNLFTAEGYLTMTLPVSESQHIFVKLTTAMLFFGVTVINSIVSLAIVTSGEFLLELYKAIAYLFRLAAEQMGAHLTFYVIEIVILLICTIASTLLLYYSCITIGQLAKKNRVLAAFGVYFAYYLITQVIGTFIASTLLAIPDFYEKILQYFVNTFELTTLIHFVLCACIIFSLILSAVYFIISKAIMKKKLNLE